MNRLSEVSGVAVGSIYQYFPNMEAIVTLAFDHIPVSYTHLTLPTNREV